jgi:superfamily I DNA/RNA helicase
MAYYFRLPVITDLTVAQQSVLNEPRPLAVSGGPGTGKSVVSLWRHIRNHSMNKKSLLLTYTKSLEAYLKSSASSENATAGENVARTYEWTTNHKSSKYDEIIIDEAQDVEIDRYKIINELTSMVSFSSDDNQMLFPSRGVKETDLLSLFPSNSKYELTDNFRNTIQIVRFVKSMFPLRLISDGNENGQEPTLILTNENRAVQEKVVLEIINNFKSETHNIAILVPLQTHVELWFNLLTSNDVICSKFTNRDGEIGTIENIHITTFKSSKGLEFDTVILPDFNAYMQNLASLYVVEENDYYVVFTRARRNIFLIDNSATMNNQSQLEFLKSQIEKKIVIVDNSYIIEK